jgi:hypothetical protein
MYMKTDVTYGTPSVIHSLKKDAAPGSEFHC